MWQVQVSRGRKEVRLRETMEAVSHTLLFTLCL